MRKFLSTTAGATFNECSPNFTIGVRKDCVELIVKLDRGIFAVVNMRFADKEHLELIASWGDYFNRFSNPTVQLPVIKKKCPKLYQLLTEGLNNIMMVREHGTKEMKFGMLIAKRSSNSLLCQIDEEMVDAVFTMANTLVSIFNEIKDNPPFPAWKDGLDEIWQ